MAEPTCRPNPIAALIRQGAEEAGRLQGSSRAATKVQRMINSLQWRQAHSKDDIYPLPLESGVVLEFRQLQAGEVTGLGTGATVWPAAHVLAKYLERRFGSDGGGGGRPGGMERLRAVDLGAGTGVAGIVAAALGAEAFLTDQEQLLFLMQENADRATAKREKPKASDATTAGVACGEIRVLTYDWGKDDASLSPPVDIVLVSDCVLPKLYPIEPLVDAIDRLSGPDTVTIMSYEHRHYPKFDPRRRFEELAAAKGLVKTIIPQARQHPIFSADDIEIWEVQRRRRQPRQDGTSCQASETRSTATEGSTQAESVFLETPANETEVVIFSSPPTTPLCVSSREDKTAGLSATEAPGLATAGAAEVRTVVGILGERHELTQTPSGALGSYLWPSALVMARHIVSTAPVIGAAGSHTRGSSSDGGSLENCSAGPPPCGEPLHRDPARVSALELGSGVGLVAMTAALLGWEFVASDKADALPLLELNVKRCVSSTKRTCAGTVDVMEYDWGTDAKRLLEGRKSSGSGDGTSYDLVICADCVYASASVEPLLASLCQVCGDNTVVLVTNELRSAFDEFVRGARGLGFQVEDVHVPEAQMVVDASTNQRPKPVALKRLRRGPPQPSLFIP
ncbi:unnamed protein product [Ectocarpus sp. CCAP 1310/34]|nr:unnamed protein product [Ectocarpus sp. CCAP 1310/34]